MSDANKPAWVETLYDNNYHKFIYMASTSPRNGRFHKIIYARIIMMKPKYYSIIIITVIFNNYFIYVNTENIPFEDTNINSASLVNIVKSGTMNIPPVYGETKKIIRWNNGVVSIVNKEQWASFSTHNDGKSTINHQDGRAETHDNDVLANKTNTAEHMILFAENYQVEQRSDITTRDETTNERVGFEHTDIKKHSVIANVYDGYHGNELKPVIREDMEPLGNISSETKKSIVTVFSQKSVRNPRSRNRKTYLKPQQKVTVIDKASNTDIPSNALSNSMTFDTERNKKDMQENPGNWTNNSSPYQQDSSHDILHHALKKRSAIQKQQNAHELANASSTSNATTNTTTSATIITQNTVPNTTYSTLNTTILSANTTYVTSNTSYVTSTTKTLSSYTTYLTQNTTYLTLNTTLVTPNTTFVTPNTTNGTTTPITTTNAISPNTSDETTNTAKTPNTLPNKTRTPSTTVSIITGPYRAPDVECKTKQVDLSVLWNGTLTDACQTNSSIIQQVSLALYVAALVTPYRYAIKRISDVKINCPRIGITSMNTSEIIANYTVHYSLEVALKDPDIIRDTLETFVTNLAGKVINGTITFDPSYLLTNVTAAINKEINSLQNLSHTVCSDYTNLCSMAENCIRDDGNYLTMTGLGIVCIHKCYNVSCSNQLTKVGWGNHTKCYLNLDFQPYCSCKPGWLQNSSTCVHQDIIIIATCLSSLVLIVIFTAGTVCIMKKTSRNNMKTESLYRNGRVSANDLFQRPHMPEVEVIGDVKTNASSKTHVRFVSKSHPGGENAYVELPEMRKHSKRENSENEKKLRETDDYRYNKPLPKPPNETLHIATNPKVHHNNFPRQLGIDSMMHLPSPDQSLNNSRLQRHQLYENETDYYRQSTRGRSGSDVSISSYESVQLAVSDVHNVVYDVVPSRRSSYEALASYEQRDAMNAYLHQYKETVGIRHGSLSVKSETHSLDSVYF